MYLFKFYQYFPPMLSVFGHRVTPENFAFVFSFSVTVANGPNANTSVLNKDESARVNN